MISNAGPKRKRVAGSVAREKKHWTETASTAVMALARPPQPPLWLAGWLARLHGSRPHESPPFATLADYLPTGSGASASVQLSDLMVTRCDEWPNDKNEYCLRFSAHRLPCVRRYLLGILRLGPADYSYHYGEPKFASGCCFIMLRHRQSLP